MVIYWAWSSVICRIVVHKSSSSAKCFLCRCISLTATLLRALVARRTGHAALAPRRSLSDAVWYVLVRLQLDAVTGTINVEFVHLFILTDWNKLLIILSKGKVSNLIKEKWKISIDRKQEWSAKQTDMWTHIKDVLQLIFIIYVLFLKLNFV